jgi:HEAT repeat protein
MPKIDKRIPGVLLALTVLGGAHPLAVLADEMLPEVVVYDFERGELSVGTEAPTSERMVNAIRSAAPGTLYAMLEYGERVECYECIPLLEKKLLDSDNAETREIAAWWLRRRPFGYGRAAVAMRSAVIEDADPVRRSRAAEALGEFLDVKGLPALSQAAMEDDEAVVRASAVTALGRLNTKAGNPIIAQAMLDDDAAVRFAAISQIERVNFFEDYEAIAGRLGDDDTRVRTRAAQISGELKVESAVDDLIELLSDDETVVRQSAAYALGRIGGSEAVSALRDAAERDQEPGVEDAIDIALKMAAR